MSILTVHFYAFYNNLPIAGMEYMTTFETHRYFIYQSVPMTMQKDHEAIVNTVGDMLGLAAPQIIPPNLWEKIHDNDLKIDFSMYFDKQSMGSGVWNPHTL